MFILSRASRLKERGSFEEWVRAARERATFMSRALDLEEIADGMIRLGLASAVAGAVSSAESLDRLSDQADTPTLLAIARLLLKTAPPDWLAFAVNDGQFIREHVPSMALESLEWMGSELDQIILDAHSSLFLRKEDGLRKAMGDAAELFIMAALRQAGRNPVHVARISDAYGYDIECHGTKIDRVEVKAASKNSMERFHLSRNEFERSCRHPLEWRLVQVIFSTKAFLSERLDTSHIEAVRELQPGTLQSLVPIDTTSFRWSESAQITPPANDWNPFAFELDLSFSTEGFCRAAKSRAYS